MNADVLTTLGPTLAALARPRYAFTPRIGPLAGNSSQRQRGSHTLARSTDYQGATMRRGLVVAVILCAGGTQQALAQCKVRSGSNEAKLLAFYAVPIVFSMATAPQEIAPGSIRIGAEGEYVPKPDPAIEQTGACFTQKSEQTSLSPVFGRPRITIGTPLFALEAAYLPPVTIAKATPNLFSFAVSHARHYSIGPVSTGTTLMFRAHGTFGNVKGAITCSKRSLQQTSATSPCYGTNPSKDTFHPNIFGGEVAAGFAPASSGFSFYAGVGANRIDPHFQVGFTDANGVVDATQVQLDTPLTRASVFGGFTAIVRRVFDVGAQIYSVPADATLIKLNGGFRFR